MTKATEILYKHLGKQQVKYLFETNEPLLDDIFDAVNEALNTHNVEQKKERLIIPKTTKEQRVQLNEGYKKL